MIANGTSAWRLRRRSERRHGFLLMDALIAAAISASALVVLINLMPQLMVAAEKRRVTAAMTNYSVAKQQDILASDFADITATASGTFNDLLGSTFPDVDAYRWSYTSYDSVPGISKCVNLVVENIEVNAKTDSITFVVVDLNDEVSS